MNLPQAYDRWRCALGEALDGRYYDIAWLDWMVMSGRAHFLATDKAASVCELRYYPTGAKDLHAIAAAGDLDEITRSLIPHVFAWGKAAGCLAMIIDSRAGWGRLLKEQGFELYKTAIRKAY